MFMVPPGTMSTNSSTPVLTVNGKTSQDHHHRERQQHPRRICDLFGLFIEAGLRCTSAVDQPSIVEYRLRNSGPRPSPRADDIG
ncbi:hypothetical protein [Streptomyces sp. NBC_00299]|uniref:hypothetical protein n=1 Tax=Streptomyces sp. NBC_00299 TaxID=2975705 RepID=UPI002E296C8D|nr:hypothetical protein [Streptomyces sp. NBC_00299]